MKLMEKFIPPTDQEDSSGTESSDEYATTRRSHKKHLLQKRLY